MFYIKKKRANKGRLNHVGSKMSKKNRGIDSKQKSVSRISMVKMRHRDLLGLDSLLHPILIKGKFTATAVITRSKSYGNSNRIQTL